MCGWLGKLKKNRIRRTWCLVSPKVLSLSTWSADVNIYILWTSQLCCYYQNMLIFFNALLIGLFFSHSVVSDSLWPHGLQHARLPCPSLSPRAYSNPRPLSQWCHPTVSSSVIPFSSCPQSFPSSGSFPVSWLFTSGGQSIGASAPGGDLYKLSMKMPKALKPKKKKNISHDTFGTTYGRIHMQKQDLSKLQTRKMKGLKKRPAERKAEDEENKSKRIKKNWWNLANSCILIVVMKHPLFQSFL